MFSEADVAAVRHIVQRILVPCVFVIGLLGNSVSIYVLTRKRMRCTTNIYLTALAITDIIYLTLLVILSLKHYDYIVQHCEAFYKLYGIFHWLIDACAYISIYIAVCFTIERFIAIRYPLKRQTFCTESLAKKVIAGVALFCLLSTISTAFEHSYIIEWKQIDGEGKPCNATIANRSPAPPTTIGILTTQTAPSSTTTTTTTITKRTGRTTATATATTRAKMHENSNASTMATVKDDAVEGYTLHTTRPHLQPVTMATLAWPMLLTTPHTTSHIGNVATVPAPRFADDYQTWSPGSGFGALAINIDMSAKRRFMMTPRQTRRTHDSTPIGVSTVTQTFIDDGIDVGVGVGPPPALLLTTRTPATTWTWPQHSHADDFDAIVVGVEVGALMHAESRVAAVTQPTSHQVADIPSIVTAAQANDKKQQQFQLPPTDGQVTATSAATSLAITQQQQQQQQQRQQKQQQQQDEEEEVGVRVWEGDEEEENEEEEEEQQLNPITAFEAVGMTTLTPTRLTQLQRRNAVHDRDNKAAEDDGSNNDDEEHDASVDDHNNMAQAEQLPWPLSLQPTQSTQPIHAQSEMETQTQTKTETVTATETDTEIERAIVSEVNPAMLEAVSTVSAYDNSTFTFNITEYCQNVTVYTTVFSNFGINELYNSIWSWYSLLVFVLIPLCILATFNCFLIMLVRRSKSLRGDLTNASSMRRFKRKSNTGISSVSQENRVTVTLIAVVLLFIVCQLPWAIYIIISLNMKIDNNLQAIIGNISNFLAAINAAANFFLYCVLSDKYRKTVREMITGYRLRRRHAHNNASLYASSSTYVNGSRRFRNSTSMTILAATPSPVEMSKSAGGTKLIT